MPKQWYRATSPYTTFGFAVEDRHVTVSAPYGRKWLIGLPIHVALRELADRGYEVITLPPV